MGIRMTNIATPMPQLRAKFTSKLGIPLSGCKVYTYEPSSDIPKTTWIDIDKTVENTNPILLDAAGEADIYLDGLYRIVVKDRFGFVVYDVEKMGYEQPVFNDGLLLTWSGRTQESKNKDFLTPEDFGATGNDYVKDTQAFRDMFASPFSTNYLPDPSKTYFINKQLDLGRKSNWLSDLNLQITGQPTDTDANLNVQAASTDQHISILFAEGEHYFKNINVHQIVQGSGWRAVLRNDFYLRSGTRPTAYKGIFKAGDIKITSDLPLTNMSGDGSGLIKFRSQHVFEVGDLYLNNAKVVFGLLDIDKSKIGQVLMQNTLQGVSISQCPGVSIGDVIFDNAEVIPEFYQLVAGANALLVMGCPNASCGDVYCTKSGEHGVRVLSFGATESLSGKEYITDLSLQSVKLIQCGGSGFKASPSDSSSVTVKNNVISLQSLYVEDCGSLDYSATAPVGDYAAINVNRYGLNLQNVNDFNCGSFITKKKNKVSNGWHNMLIRDVTNFFIGYAYLADAQAQSVFWNAGSALNPCDSFVINKLVIPNSGLLTAFSTILPAFFVIAPKYVKNLYVDMDVDNSYSAIAPSGDSTDPLGGWTVNITMGSNVTLKTVTYLTDPKYAINTRYMTASKSSGSTQLDFNTTLFAEFVGASVVRLGILDVYLSTFGSFKYVATPAGSAQPADTGARLEGEWRSMGLVGTNILCQRSR